MRWPKLVKQFTQSTPCTVTVELDGIDEDGAPITGQSWSGMGNWQDHVAEVYTKDKAETEVHARVYFDGDPFSAVQVISGGSVTAYGDTRDIVDAMKARNPDGTVNYTCLVLR